MTLLKPFPSAALLQRYLLGETAPGDLVLVPHRRLARQVWHKQRLLNLERGAAAWEPLPLMTLPDWWAELYHHLWPPYALAPPLVRLALWQKAMAVGPPLEGFTPDLPLAQALDEAHELLLRHDLPLATPTPAEPPLVRWRREVSRIYGDLLREGGWLAPGEVPAYLLAALDKGGLPLPERLFVVGLETPAPAERRWLEAVARRLPVTWLIIQGNPENLQQGLVFPDREQETAWAAARLLTWHHEQKIPLHRLAVTSPVLDQYSPGLLGVLQELLGPPAGEEGYAYNFSRGPSFMETPLWAAALLPLAFLAQGERREDLMALLLSPYYQALKPFQAALAAWDRIYREKGLAAGWEPLRAAIVGAADPRPELAALLHELEVIFTPGQYSRLTGKEWLAWLEGAWQRLGFPGDLEGVERLQMDRTAALLGDFTAACGAETLSPAGTLAWLSHGAQGVVLPASGVQEAGVQVLGALEMRGLDFDRVLCLGMNSAAFPAPTRPLPLLSRAEREQVLGGTQESQDRFAQEVFENLLGTAPHLILTRPSQDNQEPQVGTPFFPGTWEETRMPLLTRPHPAWVRTPWVSAALAHPEGEKSPRELKGILKLPLPAELRATQVGKALQCLLRFVLEELLALRELPEIEAGLDPRERGDKLHKILARFVKKAGWPLPPEEEALALLQDAAREALGREAHDLHWRAEWRRWFGDDQTPGLLPAWLARERERLAQGWRWLAAEVSFQGLTRPGWPFTVRGRLDRLDLHPERRELMVWDYKTGDIPNSAQVFDRVEEFQLPCYLLAVREGRVPFDSDVAAILSAGFICLKSPREDHLQHQDYAAQKDRWGEVLTAWEDNVRRLGERLAAGDIGPAPRPAPKRPGEGACRYCPYLLICGYQVEAGEEAEES